MELTLELDEFADEALELLLEALLLFEELTELETLLLLEAELNELLPIELAVLFALLPLEALLLNDGLVPPEQPTRNSVLSQTMAIHWLNTLVKVSEIHLSMIDPVGDRA